eukprot:c13553_g1_i1 orf=278-1669(+)
MRGKSLSSKVQLTRRRHMHKVCIAMFVGTNGCTFLDTAALIACIPNFPSNRATVIGILKGFKGLCGAIFNQIYGSFLSPDESSFILLLALGPAVVMVPLIFLMGPSSAVELTRNESDDTIFRLLYAASLLLAAYMLGVTLAQDLSSVSNTVNVILTVILFLILLLPAPVPKIADLLSKRCKENDDHLQALLLKARRPDCDVPENEVTSTPSPTFSSSSSMAPNESSLSLAEPKVAEGISAAGAHFTLRMAFANVNFWLLVFSIFFSLGSGTTAFNNLAQMAEAQGYTNTQVFVSMTNIWNFTGRLAGGYSSEISTRGYGHPRILLLAVAQLIMAVGHILFAMAWPGTIYAAVFLVAAGYGAHWAIFPTALSELFGLQNFGVLYNFINMASPAGSLIYSGLIAGPLYDWQARKQHGASWNDTSLTCEGTVCFEITFCIMAAVCLMGAALSSVLAVRTRTLYAKN